MQTTLSATPSTYRQLMKQSFAIYKAGFVKAMLLGLLLSVTIFIPRLHAYFVGENMLLPLSPFSPHRLWLVAVNLVSLFFFIGLIWHMHCVNRHIHEHLTEDIVVGAKKLLNVLLATLLQSAIMYAIALVMYGIMITLHNHHLLFPLNSLGIFIPLIVFGLQLVLIVYVATVFLFFVPLIAIENKNMFTSLIRSVSLVWNHWWRIFSLQFSPWIIYIVLLGLIKFFFGIDIHIYFTSHDFTSIWPTLLNILLFSFFIPWVAALLVVQLKDLEWRKEIGSQRCR